MAYFREAAQLATQADDNLLLVMALTNLGAALTDPASAAEAARAAAGHFRRVGNPYFLGGAIGNLAVHLQLGDWDAAEGELTQAIASEELAEHEGIAVQRGGPNWRRCAATTPPQKLCWRDCVTGGPVKRSSTKWRSAPWKPSPQRPAAS